MITLSPRRPVSVVRHLLGPRHIRRLLLEGIRTAGAFLLVGVSCLLMQTACIPLEHQRVLYNASGIQVGISTDLSVDMEASPPVINRHPAQYTPEEIRKLMGSLEVSGWSGAILGLASTPQPRPVFTEPELTALAEPIAEAFHKATLRERVFFALQNPSAPYDPDRTAGSLFFRDDYLHVILTDHYAFLGADPGGGEARDPRDTKGMKLWVARPAHPALVAKAQEPRWSPFELVHVSVNPSDVLAALRTPAAVAETPREAVPGPAQGQPPAGTGSAKTTRDELLDALHMQMKEQAATIERLQAELEELRSTYKSRK